MCAQTLHRCSSDEPFDALDFFRRANVAVCDMIAASGQVSGSTAATVHLTGNHAYCCNVGDSRIYLQRGGALQRISRDHTKYQEQLDAGAAPDAADNPDKHVLTQYLGMLGARQRLMPYFAASVPLAVGDRLLLCTDGLTGKLSDTQPAIRARHRPAAAGAGAVAHGAGARRRAGRQHHARAHRDHGARPRDRRSPAAAAGRGAVADAAVRGLGRAHRRAGDAAQEAGARAPPRVGTHRLRDPGGALSP
ncbi:MAG: PP2C family protein-serine/threonine phosphatase [Oscillospiraceae bacterium]